MTLCYILLLKKILTCYIVGQEPEPEHCFIALGRIRIRFFQRSDLVKMDRIRFFQRSDPVKMDRICQH
jgi:hypothetical protein